MANSCGNLLDAPEIVIDDAAIPRRQRYSPGRMEIRESGDHNPHTAAAHTGCTGPEQDSSDGMRNTTLLSQISPGHLRPVPPILICSAVLFRLLFLLAVPRVLFGRSGLGRFGLTAHEFF